MQVWWFKSTQTGGHFSWHFFWTWLGHANLHLKYFLFWFATFPQLFWFRFRSLNYIQGFSCVFNSMHIYTYYIPHIYIYTVYIYTDVYIYLYIHMHMHNHAHLCCTYTRYFYWFVYHAHKLQIPYALYVVLYYIVSREEYTNLCAPDTNPYTWKEEPWKKNIQWFFMARLFTRSLYLCSCTPEPTKMTMSIWAKDLLQGFKERMLQAKIYLQVAGSSFDLQHTQNFGPTDPLNSISLKMKPCSFQQRKNHLYWEWHLHYTISSSPWLRSWTLSIIKAPGQQQPGEFHHIESPGKMELFTCVFFPYMLHIHVHIHDCT